jgi:2-(3-amino-3-carboxypropyl)histidine synthase
MKVLHIETKKKFKDINLKPLGKLKGKTISIAATIQYIDLIPKIKSYLESKGKKVIIKQGAHYNAHIIGCNSSALDKSADGVLIITDGKFHAINNAIQIQKPIYIFNTKTLDKITQKEIDTYNKKIFAKQKKFLTAKKVGILLSTKHGQKLKAIKQLKSKIEKLNKKAYILESNNINLNEFENFPQIQIWVNTACPGLARDDPRIINLSDITNFFKQSS